MNEERKHNLEGFLSHTVQERAARARNEIIDGVSGYELLRRHGSYEPAGGYSKFTEAQQRFIDQIERECRPIEQGRRDILRLLGLGYCRPGYNDYACEYPVDFETGETGDFPADPTGWVESWIENLCPNAKWWNAHWREVNLGVSEYWSFGTANDYLHFSPGQFDAFTTDFPCKLPIFTRVRDGVITHQVVVPFTTVWKDGGLSKDFRAESAYPLEMPKRSR